MQKFILSTHRGNKTRTTTQAVHLSNPKIYIGMSLLTTLLGTSPIIGNKTNDTNIIYCRENNKSSTCLL